MKRLLGTLTVLALCGATVLAGASERGLVTPFDGAARLGSPALIDNTDGAQIGTERSVGDPVDFDAAMQAGADYLRRMQADATEDNAGNGNPDVPDDPDDAGWDWSSAVFVHSTAASPTNIYGATALGLYYAYLETPNATNFTAMQDAADFIVAAVPPAAPRSGADMKFLLLFNGLYSSVVTPTTLYSDAARAKYDDRITFYGSATALAEYIRDVRGVTQGYPNGIIAWDVGIFAVVAQMLYDQYGGTYDLDADAIAEVLWQDSFNDNPGLFDIVDDAGWDPTYANANFWWYTLGLTGLIDAFDASGTHTTEIPGLVTLLLDSQYTGGGISGSYGANTGDEDWQSTAYAMTSLGALDQVTYQLQINRMGYWVGATQDVSGGWVYGSGNHYPEIGGECTAGLYFTSNDLADVIVDDDFADQAAVDSYYNTPNSTKYVWGYDAFDNIQDAIDAVTGSTINVAPGTYAPFIISSTVNMLGAQAGVDARGRVVGAPNPAVESVVTAGSGILCELLNGSGGSVIDGFAFVGADNAIRSNGGPLDDLVIQNNHMAGTASSAVFLNDSGDDITVHQNSMDGSSMGSGGLFHLDSDTFDGFHFTSNWAVNQGGGFGLFVDGNRNVASSVARDPLFSGNLFKNNQQSVNVGKRALENAEISGNTFADNSYDGLLGGPKDTLITENVFVNNGRFGIALTSFGDSDPAKGAQGCTLTCNLFRGNGFIHAGAGVLFSSSQAAGTISTNVLNDNNIVGNYDGVFYSGTETIDAENNWWGAVDGPSGDGPGSGDSVTGTTADVTPFLTAPSTCVPGALVLEAADCQGDTGDTLTVELWMRDLPQNVTGFYAEVDYDTSKIAFNAGASSYTLSPFALHITPVTGAEGPAGELQLDGSVNFGGAGTSADALLVTLVFDILVDCGPTAVGFDPTPAFISELSFQGMGVATALVDTPPLRLDDTPPAISPVASNQTVECDGAGNTAALNAWLASNGGASATDNCSAVTWTNDFTALSDDCGATGSATVIFTATDECGNFSTTTATFTIEDTTDPTITTAASNLTVECDGLGNATDLATWRANYGGAAATDGCGGVTWSDDFTALSDDCGETGSALVTFTATDDCGNFSTTSATFTIEDTTDPVITGCPGDIVVNADAGGCDAVVTWTAPTASDVCCLDTFNSTHNPGDTFPQGTTTVTYTATDCCGLVETCDFDVTVNAVNDLYVEIQLVGVNVATSRCIHFQTDDCTAFDLNLPFDATGFFGDTVEIPCDPAGWTMLCAKDEQHTLWDDTTLSVVGTGYVAGTVLYLDAGDTDNDADVDINDVTWFMFQYSSAAAAGGCPWDGTTRDADFSNNGTVATEDYSMMTLNWLTFNSCPCVLPRPGGNGAIEQFGTIVEMDARSLPADVADYVDANADGVIDFVDVQEFERANGLPNDLSELIRSTAEQQASPMQKAGGRMHRP